MLQAPSMFNKQLYTENNNDKTSKNESSQPTPSILENFKNVQTGIGKAHSGAICLENTDRFSKDRDLPFISTLHPVLSVSLQTKPNDHAKLARNFSLWTCVVLLWWPLWRRQRATSSNVVRSSTRPKMNWKKTASFTNEINAMADNNQRRFGHEGFAHCIN